MTSCCEIICIKSMDETKSLSEKKIKPKVGPLGGNALISRRAATWSPHLCLRLAEIVAENTLLRLSQETSSCSSHHRIIVSCSKWWGVNMSALMYYAEAGLGLGILMVSRPTLLFTKVSHSLSFFATKRSLFLHH